MRRIVFLLVVITLAAALPAAAQIKQPRAKNPGDEGLHYVVLREFARVNEALDQLNNRIAALENQLAQMKQQNADVGTEVRSLKDSVKESSGKVNELQLTSERNLLGLNRDLVQVRSDLSNLIDLVKRSQMALGAGPLATSEQGGSKVEGYIMEVSEREVKISLGTAQGSIRGWRLGVYAAADPKTQIGQLVVTDVIDANNSKAEIILMSPGARFQFSDIVRPIS